MTLTLTRLTHLNRCSARVAKPLGYIADGPVPSCACVGKSCTFVRLWISVQPFVKPARFQIGNHLASAVKLLAGEANMTVDDCFARC